MARPARKTTPTPTAPTPEAGISSSVDVTGDLPDAAQLGDVAAPASDGSHLDEIRVRDFEADDAPEEIVSAEVAEAEAAPPPAEPMSKDAFWTVFRAGFQIPGGFVPDLAPLAIQPEETDAARAASDAIHDLLAIYYPRALMPMGETFALVLTAAPFLLAKVQVVRAVMLDRRARRHAPRQMPPQGDRARSSDQPSRADAQAKANGSPVAWMDAEEAVQ